MKTWLTPLSLSLAVLLVGGLWLHGQNVATPVTGLGKDKEKEKGTVSTSGSATVAVMPDAVRVFFSVDNLNPTVKAARDENDAKFVKVKKALAELKIEDLKLKTVEQHLQAEYTFHNNQRNFVGYRAVHQFTVLLCDSDVTRLSVNAGRVLDTGLENGANGLERIVFFKKDDTALRREALTKATEDAIANAKALCAGAKVAVLETLRVDGSPEYRVYGGGNRNNSYVQSARVTDDTSSAVPGQIEITCRVSITCAY
ncbi:hypothetical protein AYO44_01000 [Planctomycetaceae bacterium SCGC AG-212-F19]|nr:hypothetical protein AYO44_01000 [Planctomycetaceae bacterium SCGC AG-212-F19]